MTKNKQSLAALCLALAAGPATAASVQTFSPQGEVAQVRQLRARFSEPMVRFGDPRLPAPFDIACPTPGSGRWVDDKTWVFDFKEDVPAGSACQATIKPGLKALAGGELTGPTRWRFNTGGPVVVRPYPADGRYGGGRVEEEQVFALLLNGPATPDSIERFGHCQVSALAEKIPLKVVSGAVRDEILKVVNLRAQQARVATVRCARPLPPGAKLELVWAKGIATPSGVANSADRRLGYEVRTAFSASMTCERENARADCLPIRPLRLEFSSPVPRQVAERVALVTPTGERLAPQVETGRNEQAEQLLSFWERGVQRFLWLVGKSKGEVADAAERKAQEGVSAVQWKSPLPETAALRIELPPDFKDDAGRALGNAASFPLTVKTAGAPPLAKFAAAPFGILELNDQPLLPVTLRHVEADLAVKGVGAAGPLPVKDMRLTDDKQVIAWLAKVKRYHENWLPRAQVEAELGVKLPPPPPKQKPAKGAKRYGEGEEAWQGPDESKTVQTRAISLLDPLKDTRRLSLPVSEPKGDRPFEVVGIPLPEPGLHIVEIASPRLGRSLLDREAPMYVRTAALVTNLGVHFKWGAVNSGVWVTTLDKGAPVAGAQVQVSDCRGEPRWSGRTDAKGFALVPQELPAMTWEYCRKGDDEPAGEMGYFVSARLADAAKGWTDMAFVWSTWNQGLEAWRFHLPFAGGRWGDAEERGLRLHTVLDRTLLRAGQTVSMKHVARREELAGIGLADPALLPTELLVVHQGSGQRFSFPVNWRNGRHAESSFEVPKDAKLGVYELTLVRDGRQSQTTGSFRVEEFRLPVMTGRLVPQGVPKSGALVQPRELPIAVQVSYGNGGGAAGLDVRVSAQLRPAEGGASRLSERYPGFRFDRPRQPREDAIGQVFDEEYVDEDDDETMVSRRGGDAKLVGDKLAVTLDKAGAGQVKLTGLPPVQQASELLLQATYADPNGEVQTLSQTVPVHPSGVVLGVRTDRWVSVRQSLPTQVLALDTAGKPLADQAVTLHAVLHKVQSTRRRLVGGFYAYDNQRADEDLGEVCSGRTDARGLLLCDVKLKAAGDVELIARAADSGGNKAEAAASAWVTRQGELWFGGENDDRMDVIPEQRSYEPGQTARFQVRMPFRHAQALVAIERNGILETLTIELNGKDPTIELPVKAEWGPNVYVSVLAVRGRVREVPWYSFFQWGWRQPGEWWGQYRSGGEPLPAPTALIDLAKPAFKYGIAEISVGTAGHRLKVEVATDKPSYPIRANAQVKLKVTLPDGKPAPAGTEVAVAAVDEALLELMPNGSWNLLDAMIKRRAYDVETSTAQMHIVGKRHFGKKAAAAGGGGGQFPTRELFDTLLLWNPRVTLDANGQATVSVPLNDALTSFRIVAVADAVHGKNAGLFGTGQASIRSTQDLQIVAGLPPLVREGDRYRAAVTLRNTTTQPMEVKLAASIAGGEGGQTLAPQTVKIAAGGAQEAAWDVLVPFNVKTLEWTISAESAAARDRMKFTQKVAEAVPVTVQQATLLQLDGPKSLAVAPPQTALRDSAGAMRGGIDLTLAPRLGDGLAGVREYFRRYPWGCLEQQASVALGLRESARWQGLMERLPLYLDDDGLAHYFPPGAGSGADPATSGSDTLTAYLLSASAEAGSGYAIPDASRSRMEAGLIAFVEGKVERKFWVPAFLRNGDLDVRKLSALEALSRSGKVQPRLLQSIQILPNQWPTAAVIDWLMVLDRTPGLPEREQRMAEAENILRARLNLQGTRMGFSTERDDNWWWLMANGDVNATRLLLAVMQRPTWKDDMPRLVTGALQRQQYGRWSTTPANVWGVLALEAFSRRFESEPVAGSTRAGFDGQKPMAWDWAGKPQGGTLSMGWPVPKIGAASAPLSAGDVKVTQDGTGKPWLTVVSKAAVPVEQPFSSGYRITKTLTPVEQKVAGSYSRGDVFRVTLKIDAQADMTWVVVHDPIPGSSTLLGSGLGRDSALATEGEQRDGRGWLAYEERSFEAFRAYYRYLPKGPLTLEYTVRLNNPGDFGLPQTRVEAMYAPEMFGESPNARWVVKP